MQNISLSAVKYVKNKLNDSEGEIGVGVFQKFNNVFNIIGDLMQYF